MQPPPFITLENITVRLHQRRLLERTSWCIRRGENWVVWGPNGAGKSTLAQVLMGQAAVVEGAVHRHYQTDPSLCGGRPGVALVSAEQYHRLYQRERLLGHMRHFSGQVLESTSAGDLLKDEGEGVEPESRRRKHIEEALQLRPLAARPLAALSSGEMRRLLLGRALLSNPCLLILDEPYNGLDGATRQKLAQLLGRLSAEGMQMVLITHRLTEIAEGFDRVLQLTQGQAAWQGSKEAFLRRVGQGTPAEGSRPPGPPAGGDSFADELIRMTDVTVRFGEKRVLDRIRWTMRADQHWALIGPNGAGKSTLLALITGDQLQAYAHEIFLFGRKKGSGESVWEIKQHIGWLGDELQARYQRHLTGFDVVCSGFFDSVGLYRRCTAGQRRKAAEWVCSLGIKDLAEQSMQRLSFGQQRLILIARAVVKGPRLLILDEPCNGLDAAYRRRVLDMLDSIGATGRTRLLYVSHRPDEIPACITHRLCLEAGRIVQSVSG